MIEKKWFPESLRGKKNTEFAIFTLPHKKSVQNGFEPDLWKFIVKSFGYT